jgi:hypothetical protein
MAPHAETINELRNKVRDTIGKGKLPYRAVKLMKAHNDYEESPYLCGNEVFNEGMEFVRSCVGLIEWGDTPEKTQRDILVKLRLVGCKVWLCASRNVQAQRNALFIWRALRDHSNLDFFAQHYTHITDLYIETVQLLGMNKQSAKPLQTYIEISYGLGNALEMARSMGYTDGFVEQLIRAYEYSITGVKQHIAKCMKLHFQYVDV